MLKTYLYSAIKSEDSEAPDSGTSRLGTQRGFGGIEMKFRLCNNVDANQRSAEATDVLQQADLTWQHNATQPRQSSPIPL